MLNHRTLWRKDLAAVPAAERRLARYALQFLHGAPDLGPRRRSQYADTLGALWQLLQPLFEPRAIAVYLTQTDDRADEEEEAIDTWDEEPFNQLTDRMLRQRLRDCFATVPPKVVARLAKADGEAILSPTVALLGESLGLDATALRVLDFLGQHTLVESLRTLLRECGAVSARINLPRLAALLDLPDATLRTALSRRAPLHALGLIRYDGDPSDLEDFARPTELLREVLDAAPTDSEALLDFLIEPAPAGVWGLESFPHLSGESERLREVLSQAATTAAIGVNALFHGAPGTGKTELARALAGASGLRAYQVRSADFDSGDNLFALLRGSFTTGKQKGWMNRILEENPVPAIWIANQSDGMDPAFLRRFLLPVAFVTPPRSVRRQMAELHLGGCGLAPDLLDELASDPVLAPAQLGAPSARPASHRPPEATVRTGVAALRTLLHGAPAPRRRTPVTDFDVAYLNLTGGMAPSAIAQGRGSLCFYGPPGTGKTAFSPSH